VVELETLQTSPPPPKKKKKRGEGRGGGGGQSPALTTFEATLSEGERAGATIQQNRNGTIIKEATSGRSNDSHDLKTDYKDTAGLALN